MLVPFRLDYQSLTFFSFDMEKGFKPPAEIHPFFECRSFDSALDPWLSRLCENYPEKLFYRRIKHGYHQCYLLTQNKHIVAYAWVTTSSCYVGELEFMLPIGVGRFYIYDCYVEPGFRGRGLYQLLLRKIVFDYSVLRWPGCFRAACIAADPSNRASVRGITRAGFREFARATYWRAGSMSGLYGIKKLVSFMNSAADPLR